MIQHVDSVLVAKTIPGSFSNADALNPGEVALFDQNRKVIENEAAAAAATTMYFGVAQNKVNVTMPNGSVEQKANIKFGNKIRKNSKSSAVISEYVAPKQDKITITLTDATIVAGHRYVLRMVYKDIYEAPGQFTHTYEVYANDTDAEKLAEAIVKKINKHANRRITASNSAAVITLTAMEKDDNEGLNSLNEYSIVNMEATLYTTVPGALLSNQPEAVPGATIVKEEGTPGKGFWKQVRDSEVRFMGYNGHVFTGAYPEIKQDLQVEKDATYDYIVIENDNEYLSNDNQYIKTTPLTTELYIKHTGSFTSSDFVKMVKAFLTGKVSE